ncbi:MAG: hypothetical protein ING89_15695 [Rubrivivax sp.]|nr:hypothetical protein [Rubrivivax sp.]
MDPSDTPCAGRPAAEADHWLLALHRNGDGAAWQADLLPAAATATTMAEPRHFDTLPALMHWLARLDDTPPPGIR